MKDDRTSIEKFSFLLETLMKERAAKLRDVGNAQAILQKAPPVEFDHEAAARAVAQARVSDLMNGTDSVGKVVGEFEQQRIQAGEAAAAHDREQTEARKSLEEHNRLVHALAVQAAEIDTAIRGELAAEAFAGEADALQRLIESATAFFTDYVSFKALKCVQRAETRGEGRRQFSFPEQHSDLNLSVPREVQDMLPRGWARGMAEVVIYKRYDLASVIHARAIEIMAERSSGLYPRVGSWLTAQSERPSTP